MRRYFLIIASVVIVGCTTTAIATQPESIVAVTPINVNNPEKTHIKESKVAFYKTQKPEGSSGGLASLVSGTLEVRQHCLVVITDSGTVAQPIFPSYNIVWNEANNILNHKGKQYKGGDHIELGGGFIPSATIYLSSNSHIPDCPDAVLFLTNG